MSSTEPSFGPGEDQLKSLKTAYYANESAVKSIRNSRRQRGTAAGAIFGSPIVFGASDEYYDFNLDYYKVVRNDNFNFNEKFPSALADYSDAWTDVLSPYYYSTGTSEGTRLKQRREENVKTHTFAGSADQLTIRSNYRKLNSPNRSTAAELSNEVLTHVVKTIQGAGSSQGLFASIIPGAPNGFLVSEAYDFDVQYGDQDPASIESARLLSTYWPERLGSNHPLRDLYDKFFNYSDSSARQWNSSRDRAGTPLTPGTTIAHNNPLKSSSPRSIYDYSEFNDPAILIAGPFSQSDLRFGDGNNIIISSPMMSIGLHRTLRSDVRYPLASVHTADDFFADTILYPSPVGQYLSNTLSIGDGNNLVYYDSSFSDIKAGKGNNIFIPSFGSFNWSISWIPAYGTNLTTGSEEEPWGSTLNLNSDYLLENRTEKQKDWNGIPLISPIPWDRPKDPSNNEDFLGGLVYNPKDGGLISGSYTSSNEVFAKDPNRGSVNNLYTINTFLDRYGADDAKKTLQKTYFNGKQLNDKDGPVASYNPVNRLGGLTIRANGGNNTFFGMDWSYWKHLLPSVGLTTANQQVDDAQKITRAAQHAWESMTFIGGRGNNTFNLGNVIDNITNNGLFYKGDFSYRISLAHEDVFDSEGIYKQGLSFGNNNDPVTGSALQSVVNLQLKADPATKSVTIQDADPGQSGASVASQVSAWNSVGNTANKLIGNPIKMNEDYNKNWATKLKDKDGKAVAPPSWIAKSTKIGKLIGQAVPFLDTAISVISAVTGLINLFSAKPSRPPKDKIEVTYLQQGLDRAKKAVLINDWHPGTKVNLNLPQVDKSQWNAITLSVNPPTGDSTSNTSQGVYFNINVTSPTGAKTDFPLVVLENVGRTQSGSRFGYFSYDFLDLKNTGLAFTALGINNLRLFGSLPDPSKLLDNDDKTALNPTIFPQKNRKGDKYTYYSPDGFNMDYDIQNYASTIQNPQKDKSFYSRYYFNTSNISISDMPPGWSSVDNLQQYTSNVSLEFDSRTLGWYWQPVIKVLPNLEDNYNPDLQSIDFDQSRLWIKNALEAKWEYTSFADLSFNTKAYSNSKRATTFYYSALDGQGDLEIKRRSDEIQQLDLLASFLPDIRSLDQRLIRDDRSRIYALGQVLSVQSIPSAQAEGSPRNGLRLVFNSVDAQDQETTVDLFLYSKDGVVKANYYDPIKRLEAETVMARISRLTSLPDFDQHIFIDQRQFTRAYLGGDSRYAYSVGSELTSVDDIEGINFIGDPAQVGSSIEVIYRRDNQRYLTVVSQHKKQVILGAPPDNNLYWVSAYQGPIINAATLSASGNFFDRPINDSLKLEIGSDAPIQVSRLSTASDSYPPDLLPWIEQTLPGIVQADYFNYVS